MINREHYVGMTVKFIGCSRSQIKSGGHTDPKGLLKEGNLIMFEAFGAGFTWGSNLLRF